MEKLTIKDLATKAGVSVGTVDRVLHNRPGASAEAVAKVKKALEELNYRTNMVASALAKDREYQFVMLLPNYASEPYWKEIEDGALKAEEVYVDFRIKVHVLLFDPFTEGSFATVGEECLKMNPDGVVFVPSFNDETRKFAMQLVERGVQFVQLDSYMSDLPSLSFIGQDSYVSGAFAAKMLMLQAKGEKRVLLLRASTDGRLATKQQSNREVGLSHYMSEYYPDVEVISLDVPLVSSKASYAKIFDNFFKRYPDIKHALTMSSRAYILGEYLLSKNDRERTIMGYEMIDRNVECLKNGSVSFLIAQHAYMQGFSSIYALHRGVILQSQVAPRNYMPIELLTQENYRFYRKGGLSTETSDDLLYGNPFNLTSLQ